MSLILVVGLLTSVLYGLIENLMVKQIEFCCKVKGATTIEFWIIYKGM